MDVSGLVPTYFDAFIYTTFLYNFLSFVILDYYPVLSIFSHILIGSLVRFTLTSSSTVSDLYTTMILLCPFLPICRKSSSLKCSGQKILSIVLKNDISVVSVRLIICEELSCILWLIGG